MDPKTKDSPASGGAPAATQGDTPGEGNYSATHRYNEGLAKSVEKGDAEKLAEKAKQALEGPEGQELREAEQKAKQGAPKPDSK